MEFEFELFPGKKMNGLFKDIYINQRNKKARISELIAEVRKYMKNSNDILMLMPVVKDLVDTSVRNDESLIKLATIAQKLIILESKNDSDNGLLTDKEKAQLLKDFEDTIKEVADDQDLKVDNLTNEVEEIKQKMKR